MPFLLVILLLVFCPLHVGAQVLPPVGLTPGSSVTLPATTCVDEVGIGLSPLGVLLCGPVLPAMAPALVAAGVDVSAIGEVTHTHFLTPLPLSQGGLGLTVGHPGGVLYFSAEGQLDSSATFPINAPLLGGGPGQAPVAGTLTGTTRQLATVLGTLTPHKQLTFDANGNIIASVFEVGSDGTLVLPVPVSQGGTGLTVGTSGGLLYFPTTSTMASSPVLAAGTPLFGGGPGQPPVSGTRSGTTLEVATVTGAHTTLKQLMFDSSGNIIVSASDIGSPPQLPLLVSQGGTGLTAGTPGGLLYFPTASLLASSPVLPAGAPLFGGGDGQPPVTGTRTGTTHEVVTATGAHATQKQLMFDGNGNLVASTADIGSGLTLPVSVPQGGTGLSSGTAGGLLYFSTTGTLQSSSPLAANEPLFGGGSGQPPLSGSRSGTTTQVGTVSGAHPTLKQLMFDSSGNIVASATDIGSSTLALPIPVAQGGTGLTSGTSGGLLYFPLPGTLASSPVLTANAPLFGGGSGQPPVSGTRTGTTLEVATVTGAHTTLKQLMFDSSGNIVASAVDIGGSALALPVLVPQGGTGLVSGTPGSLLYFATATTLAPTQPFAANAPLFGGGAGQPPVTGTRSGTTLALASVAPPLTPQKQLMFDSSGNIVASAFEIGSGLPIPVSVPQGGTGLTSGTPGGVLFFSAGTTLASTAALPLSAPLMGGGAGAGPVAGTRSGTTTEMASVTGSHTTLKQLMFDVNGNIVASGADIGGTSEGTPSGVSSVFGRAGAVTSQAGDYSAAQVTNAADRTLANVWPHAGGQSMPVLVLTGSLSGSLALRAAPSGGPAVLIFPSGTMDLSQTGGPGHVVQQHATGAPFTVGPLAFADLSGTASVCTITSVCPGYQAALGFTPENVVNKSNAALDSSLTLYPTNNAVKSYVDTGLATKQATLGFTPENVVNKSNAALDSSLTLYPTNNAVKSYVDTGLATKQATLGFTPENVVNKSNAALDSSLTLYPTNNAVKSYVDTGLATKQATLGFTPENVVNKSNAALDSSLTLYPTNNAVKSYVDTGLATKQATLGFTPENVVNKSNAALDSSSTLYPTNNAAKLYIDAGLTTKQATLGFTPENVVNKSNATLDSSSTLYPTNNAAKLYVDAGLATKQALLVPPAANQVQISTATGVLAWVTLPACALAFNTTTHLFECAPAGVSFANITAGTNSTATMTVGSGAALVATGTGQIQATTVPGTGVTSPLSDAVIPHLNTLSTGLTPLRCVGTDALGQLVSATGACGTGGGGSFADLTSGTNTTATMVIGTGASLQASDAGFIVATNMPGEGLTTPVPDTMIPPLNSLSTGLTPLRCVETSASGTLVSATTACNVGAGGSGVWGGITGTLSNQTDLQAALDFKVPTARTVNGHPLSSDIAVTAADVGLDNVSNLSDAQRASATEDLTNKHVVPRVQALSVTANHVTPNADNTDVGYNYTFAAGLTIDTPTFTITPKNQQLLAMEFATATPQVLTWASGYTNECGLQLPTSTTGMVGGQQVYNRFLYRYSSTTTKWCLTASTKSDAVRVTTLGSSNTYLCPADNSDQCEMSHTLATGTITLSDPGGAPSNGQRLRLGLLCTNAQTLSWNAIFSDGPVFIRPTTCPAGTTKWTVIDVQYSAFTVKWQVVLSDSLAGVSGAAVTTLTSSTTYTCPTTSTACEMAMTGTAGTLTVASPGGVPTNGQGMRLSFLCTNAQTLSWNAIFIDGPVFIRPPTCPANTSQWLVVDAIYSTVLTKWQLVRGQYQASVVKTDQANTYTTGAQSYAAATSLTLPSAPGAAPTTAGGVAYDTTQHTPKYGENGMLSSSPARLIYMSDAGNSNNGQSGDFLHTGATITIPANYMVQHRVLRVWTFWRFTTAATPGSLVFKVRLVSPATDLAVHTVGTPQVNKTNWTISLCWLLVAKDAPGAAANVYTAPLAAPTGFQNLADMNQTAQPIGIATNASFTITMISRWNTPVSGNIVTPDLFLVEALN